MRTSSEGILYPTDALRESLSILDNEITESQRKTLPAFVMIPHSSWRTAAMDIAQKLSGLRNSEPSEVFVLAPLHKGPVNFDDPYCVYCAEDGMMEGSDWRIRLRGIEHESVRKDDDVCSEEHSLEVVAPFLAQLFPDAAISFLLAPGFDARLVNIVDFLLKSYPNSLFLVSNNKYSDCGAMWIHALRDNGVSI